LVEAHSAALLAPARVCLFRDTELATDHDRRLALGQLDLGLPQLADDLLSGVPLSSYFCLPLPIPMAEDSTSPSGPIYGGQVRCDSVLLVIAVFFQKLALSVAGDTTGKDKSESQESGNHPPESEHRERGNGPTSSAHLSHVAEAAKDFQCLLRHFLVTRFSQPNLRHICVKDSLETLDILRPVLGEIMEFVMITDDVE